MFKKWHYLSGFFIVFCPYFIPAILILLYYKHVNCEVLKQNYPLNRKSLALHLFDLFTDTERDTYCQPHET